MNKQIADERGWLFYIFIHTEMETESAMPKIAVVVGKLGVAREVMEEPGLEFEKMKLLHCQSVINNVYKEVPKASRTTSLCSSSIYVKYEDNFSSLNTLFTNL